MTDADNEGAAPPLPKSESEQEQEAATSLTIGGAASAAMGVEHTLEDQVSSSELLQQQHQPPVPLLAQAHHDVATTKRPRVDEDASTSELLTKRQRVTDDTDTEKSIMDKLKAETEQLIENPEKALMPDPIPPGDVGISTFHDNDVLSGRGGGTNVHPGNRNFRDLINLNRRLYLKARKNDKPSISRAIVRSIRNNHGRFLKKDEKSGQWFEIGDDAAREKTSQALRQRAPEMRKILFDTEREEARVATESQMRQQQQQRMMGAGMASPQNGAGVLPAMASGIPPMAMHPGMMYAPGMMMMNPALFMSAQQQQQGAKAASPGNAAALQPNMTPMMMDPYQQAAMFQTAFMANPAMMMNPMMQLQQAAAFSAPNQANVAGASVGVTPSSVDGSATQANPVSNETLPQGTSATALHPANQNNETSDQDKEQAIAEDGVQANQEQAQTSEDSGQQEGGSEKQVTEI